MTYKKTVKKYKNKNTSTKNKNTTQGKVSQNSKKYDGSTTTIAKQDNTININEKPLSNSEKPENKTDHNQKHHKTQAHANSNLKEMQNQDTLAKKNDKITPILYSVLSGVLTIIAIMLIGKSVFNYTFFGIVEDIFFAGRIWSLVLFFIFFLCSILGICFITLSNKTDNKAYLVDIILYTALLIMSFVISLLLYRFSFFIPSAIILIITTILSIYLTYRYYVSVLLSGILQTLSTIILLYGTYIALALSL